ncbi:hypothetical protein G6F47_013866 [Rhizopus delemar]|nr:hypothetical protein G6F47_013866 [Rhizopus delemar]
MTPHPNHSLPGNSQSGIPDWFIVYQKQQQDQTRFLNQRLNALEEVMAENKRLRTDLDLAQQRIAELEAQLLKEQKPQSMPPKMPL